MYQEALAAARRAIKLLRNREGWTIRVWENCGWHASIRHDYIDINISKPFDGNEIYWTMMTTSKRFVGTGDTHLSVPGNKHFRDPNDALDNQLKVAEAHFADVAAALATFHKLKKDLKGGKA